MQDLINKIEQTYKKSTIPQVKSGDTVKVTQKIKEGEKERLQTFEGMVIRTKRMNSHTASITVRKIASGIGVEKTFMIHSPLITKIEITKRSKVNRNYLSYMRERTGKSTRLRGVGFDSEAVNVSEDTTEPAEESAADTAQEKADTQPETNKQPEEKPADQSAEETDKKED